VIVSIILLFGLTSVLALRRSRVGAFQEVKAMNQTSSEVVIRIPGYVWVTCFGWLVQYMFGLRGRKK
jgi:hypothetical protein